LTKCEVRCVRGGPARVRVWTEDLARCPVCFGRAHAIRGDVLPSSPLIRRAARALAHGAGQLALAFAGDLGDIYREMTVFPERKPADDQHPSGPLPVLIPGRRPGLSAHLGARARAPLGPGPGRPGDDIPGDHPADPDGPEQAGRRARPHLPRALRAAYRRTRPAGRADALPD